MKCDDFYWIMNDVDDDIGNHNRIKRCNKQAKRQRTSNCYQQITHQLSTITIEQTIANWVNNSMSTESVQWVQSHMSGSGDLIIIQTYESFINFVETDLNAPTHFLALVLPNLSETNDSEIYQLALRIAYLIYVGYVNPRIWLYSLEQYYSTITNAMYAYHRSAYIMKSLYKLLLQKNIENTPSNEWFMGLNDYTFEKGIEKAMNDTNVILSIVRNNNLNYPNLIRFVNNAQLQRPLEAFWKANSACAKVFFLSNQTSQTANNALYEMKRFYNEFSETFTNFQLLIEMSPYVGVYEEVLGKFRDVDNVVKLIEYKSTAAAETNKWIAAFKALYFRNVHVEKALHAYVKKADNKLLQTNDRYNEFVIAGGCFSHFGIETLTNNNDLIYVSEIFNDKGESFNPKYYFVLDAQKFSNVLLERYKNKSKYAHFGMEYNESWSAIEGGTGMSTKHIVSVVFNSVSGAFEVFDSNLPNTSYMGNQIEAEFELFLSKCADENDTDKRDVFGIDILNFRWIQANRKKYFYSCAETNTKLIELNKGDMFKELVVPTSSLGSRGGRGVSGHCWIWSMLFPHLRCQMDGNTHPKELYDVICGINNIDQELLDIGLYGLSMIDIPYSYNTNNTSDQCFENSRTLMFAFLHNALK